MNLRQKIIWFAVTPLILALGAIATTVYHRAALLEQQQRGSIEHAYRDSKDAELKNYSTLAEQSIAHLYASGRTDAATMNEAKTILASLNYGPDGYFFLFDLQGTFLMHPRQPELVGQNLWHLRDANGDPAIQKLISRALEGGGLVDYTWQKPTNHNTVPVPKRAYVLVLKNWSWVLGTGVYLDDIDVALAKLDKQASQNIFDTMLWIVVISSLSVIAIVSGLMWSIRKLDVVGEKLELANKELKEANAKLKGLTQRIIRTQDDERHRISDDLHCSIKSMLVAIRMKIDVGIHKLPGLTQQTAAAQSKFKEAIKLVNDTLDEIDQVIDGLHPIYLEQLGLEGALRQCAYDFDSDAMRVEFNALGDEKGLPPSAGAALTLVTREALANASKYSSAKRVSIRLESDARRVTLSIYDDGHGFNVDRINADPNHGLGLLNMKERIEAEGGEFRLTSSSSGTAVTATIPFSSIYGLYSL